MRFGLVLPSKPARWHGAVVEALAATPGLTVGVTLAPAKGCRPRCTCS